MTRIGTLTSVDPRVAWAREAGDFTPWLAEHLDELGRVIGMTALELVETEVKVEGFAADILARNALDDTRVLIENQLERTDHTHLGQIMTYLAGLDASVVVWIATEFREPHLSAIRWLNEHTVDPFAFFAIRLRVVRIGDSPVAPIFDVLERPNGWERTVKEAARETEGETTLGAFRRAWWTAYLDKYPEDEALGVGISGKSNCWLRVAEDVPLLVAIYVAQRSVGVYVRGPLRADTTEAKALLAANASILRERIGVEMGDPAGEDFLGSFIWLDTRDPANRERGIDWQHEQAHRYLAVLRETFCEASA